MTGLDEDNGESPPPPSATGPPWLAFTLDDDDHSPLLLDVVVGDGMEDMASPVKDSTNEAVPLVQVLLLPVVSLTTVSTLLLER